MLLEAAGRTGASRRNKQSHSTSRRRHKGSYSDNGSSDLYKNEADREELSKLTELEREMILSDRAAKKDDRKLHKQMRSRLTSEKKSQSAKDISPPTSSRGVRSSTRYEYSSKKRKGIRSSSSGSSSESENGSDSRSERDKTISNTPTYEQIKTITIKRSKLVKWVMEPFFEDLIVGCFVRVGIGIKDGRNIYRLCMVQNVDASDPNKKYQLENKTTYKYLNCVWGSERAAARWQIIRVSDSPPTLEEYNDWRREIDRSGGRMPHTNEVLEKLDAIDKINSFVYSANTVKQMLQEKKNSVSARPLNIAVEKEKLRRALEIAEYKEEGAEAERIKARLQELEAARQGQGTDAKALRLAEMNRKNRAENFRVSSLRAADQGLNPGDAGYDPFSRRWTRSTNYFAKQESKPAATTEGTAQGGEISKELTATTAALEAAAGAGKLVDTKAPVDKGTESNMLHNFELPISLTLLERFGGAYGAASAFLARKQKIEAKIGCQVPVNDGKTHSLTLSVGDYKRRRGLL
ncbi:Protein RTF1-like protein [Bienertia sinuspersici]